MRRVAILVWIAPSFLFCLVGAALVWECTHSGGELAGAGVLLGATLVAFTLFPVSVAVDHLVRASKLREHMTHRHSVARKRKTEPENVRVYEKRALNV
jgi:hypothetical protein